MPRALQKNTEPLVLTSVLPRQLKELRDRVGIARPKHGKDGFCCGQLVALERVVEDCREVHWTELPEVSNAAQVHTAPWPIFCEVAHGPIVFLADVLPKIVFTRC